MRFLTVIVVGLFLVSASLCEAAVVQKRIYRNTEEVLVPVTVIKDGDEIKEVIAPQVKTTETKVTIPEDIVKAVDEEQKLLAAEQVAEAQRRFDEAIVEEEIKEVVAEENKELLKAVAEEEKLEKEIIKTEEAAEQVQKIKQEEQLKTVPEIPHEIVIHAEEPTKIAEEPLQQIKSVIIENENPEQVLVIVETNNGEAAEQPEGSVRQATQPTPTQTSTQQNFVQQFIQNSPLGQFFNQLTGQNQQGQVANDEGANPAPADPSPTNPGFLNPVTALTNAAQSAVNSTTQAFQGIQQFANNLGSQFQNTLSSLTGQQQQLSGANDATTPRPPGPIQQLVNTFMGNNNQQQTQPAPGQQGPLQGLLNIFQGNNRPQSTPAVAPAAPAAAATNPEPQPAKEPEITEQANDAAEEIATNTADDLNNEVRDSNEVRDDVADSFEDTEDMISVKENTSQVLETADDDGEQVSVPK